jgi:hypothetical protein
MSSHLLTQVEQVCDRVAVIVRGRVVEEGPPSRLGAIRRRVRVQVGAADTEVAARLLACWPARELDGQFVVEHDSGLPDRGVAHFDDAIALAERIGAQPAVAHSLVALSDALTLRGGDGDEQQAANLRRQARELARRLGMTPLLRRLVTPADEWMLRRDGEGWLLEAGGGHARLPDSRGLQQLRALLAAPRHDIPALDLAAGGPGLLASGVARGS